MSRRKARETALQALFQLDFNQMDKAEAMDAALHESDVLSDGARTYMQQVVEGTLSNLAAVDRLITDNSREWKVDRMPGVDRNIARIAIYEMRFGEEKITPNIVINEAVELAKKFGSDDSARFVNGILDAIAKNNK